MSPATTTDVSYPPAAHAAPARASQEAIAAQPAPAPAMSLNPEENETQRASRLRGGCIPLPVSPHGSGVLWGSAELTMHVFSGRRNVLYPPVLLLDLELLYTMHSSALYSYLLA
jgi:hypothetical protein